MYVEQLFSMIRREVERTVKKFHKTPRMGLVSSYDPVKHAVKVQFQPSGTESGWIPLSGMAIGNKFGVLFAPNIKDQVEVHFHEGEHMVARVMTRHFSKFDVAPQLQAGEYAQIHQSGSVITHKQDGTLQIGGAGTVQTGQIGGGKSGNVSTGGQQGGTGQQQPYTQPNAKQTITLKPDGTLLVDVPNNDMTITVDKTNFNLTAKNQVNVTSSSSDINITSNAGKVNVTASASDVHVTSPTKVQVDTPLVLVSGIVQAVEFDGSMPAAVS